MQSFNALLIENQLLKQALSEKQTAGQESLLWVGTSAWNFGLELWPRNSECESFQTRTKFKDLSYEIGLRKPVQQQLQHKMGELHQQAKENVARPMFDEASFKDFKP